MEKKKKFRSKILTLAFCGLAALSMSAATTFAWFTQNITPKVSQFGMKVITANDDLNISFNYKGSNWSPFGPTVAAKYFGVDGDGTALAADGVVGFFEATDTGTANTLETYRLTNFSTSKYVDGSTGDITTPDATGGLLKLYDRSGTAAGGANNTTAGIRTGTYLKLTFKFQSATQYNVCLNTKAGEDGTADEGKTVLKNTYVQPFTGTIADETIPSTIIRNRAWDAVETTSGKSVLNATGYSVDATKDIEGYEALVVGTELNTRGAYAIRLGFVGDKVISSGDTGTYYYDSNAGKYTTTWNSYCGGTSASDAQKYAETTNVPNIWDPFEDATADYSEVTTGLTGFPNNEKDYNMAYQYERYNAAVMDEDEPKFVAPAASTIKNSAASGSWTDKVLVTLSPVDGQDYFEGTLDVYIWLEGYDGDCFNDILNDVMTVAMQFKGVVPATAA